MGLMGFGGRKPRPVWAGGLAGLDRGEGLDEGECWVGLGKVWMGLIRKVKL